MNNLSSQGRTILFVSHQMNAVENVCSRGMILDQGRVDLQSHNIRDVINTYLSDDGEIGMLRTAWKPEDNKLHNPYFDPQIFYLSNSEDQLLDLPVRNDKDVFVNIKFKADNLDPALVFGYDVFDHDHNHIFACNQTDSDQRNWPKIKIGYNHVRMKLPPHFLNEGDYFLKLVASLNNRMWLVNPFAVQVKIDLIIRGGLSESPFWTEKRGGFVAPIFPWEVV
jgi:lipopolysaccharide transport system ATP-binding protein